MAAKKKNMGTYGTEKEADKRERQHEKESRERMLKSMYSESEEDADIIEDRYDRENKKRIKRIMEETMRRRKR